MPKAERRRDLFLLAVAGLLIAVAAGFFVLQRAVRSFELTLITGLFVYQNGGVVLQHLRNDRLGRGDHACDRLCGEELFPRTLDALQTCRHAHHPRSAWCLVCFDDFQNGAPRHPHLLSVID